MRKPSRHALIAIALLIVALAVRLAAVEATSYRPINDAGSYLTLASEVAHTGDYSNSHRPGKGAGGTRGPSAYFPPGFPCFREPVDPFLILSAACAVAAVPNAVRRLARAPVRGERGAPVAARPGELVQVVERLA